MALMIGNYLEIKTGASIKRIRKQLWMIHKAELLDAVTGKTHIMRMAAQQTGDPLLIELLETEKRTNWQKSGRVGAATYPSIPCGVHNSSSKHC